MVKYCEEMRDYVLDVYVDIAPRYKVWLIDINPWIPGCTDSLLFEWENLDSLQEFEFRIVTDQKNIKPVDTHGYKVPIVRFVNY